MAALVPADERTQLLDNVRQTFFANAPANLLYLGAGTDVSNPYGCTHTTAMTFVDTQAFDADAANSIENKIKEIFGDTTQFVRTEANNEVTRITASNADGQAVMTIDLKHMGYEPYFQNNNVQFACIFDKDSWLDDASVAVVSQFVQRLQANGYWISNSSNLASDSLDNLITAVGLNRVTGQLNNVLRFVSFGFSTIQVFQKTNTFDAALFNIVYTFAKELKPLFLMVDEHQVLEQGQGEDYDDIIDAQVDAADLTGANVNNYNTIQQLILNAGTQLKQDIRALEQ